ncbi:MAG TPA: hypothetical protein PK156_36650 [Polyangium sp.]|nr:hypothetical protein [Polyangium sp.]
MTSESRGTSKTNDFYEMHQEIAINELRLLSWNHTCCSSRTLYGVYVTLVHRVWYIGPHETAFIPLPAFRKTLGQLFLALARSLDSHSIECGGPHGRNGASRCKWRDIAEV